MQDKVVDIRGRPRAALPLPVPDGWFGLVDHRLGRIEVMITRLEWKIWLIVCGAASILALEIIKAVKPS